MILQAWARGPTAIKKNVKIIKVYNSRKDKQIDYFEAQGIKRLLLHNSQPRQDPSSSLLASFQHVLGDSLID